MDLPPLPPADDVYAALKQTVIPAAGVAALVYAVFLSLGRWAGAVGSAAAVLGGLAYANWIEARLPWNPDSTKSVRIAWEWLPRSALLLVVVGLLSRWIGLVLGRTIASGPRWWLGNLAVWLPRLCATIAVAFWLVPDRLREPDAWLLPALASAVFLEWIILDGLARSGQGARVSFYQAAMFFAASAVILYSHSARFMDVSAMAGAAFFAIAVVGSVSRQADSSGAVPAGVCLLPGLILSTKAGTESQVPPLACFLVALAPLVLAPWLIPTLARRSGPVTQICRWILVLIPLTIAAVLAGRAESLPWEAEW